MAANLLANLAKLKADKQALLKKKQAATTPTSAPVPSPSNASVGGTAAARIGLGGGGGSSSSSSAGGAAGAAAGAHNSTNFHAGTSSDTSSPMQIPAGGQQQQQQQQISSSYSFVPQKEKFSLNPGSDQDDDAFLNQEYDPLEPNNYDEIVKKRRRAQQNAQIKKHQEKELERQRKAAEAAAPPEDDAATAYMKKFGWKEGSGLGREQQGITAPLIMRKTDRGAGTVVQGTTMPARKFDPKVGPSTVVVLMNAVGRGEVDEDLQEEMTEEAGKYGKVVSCVIKEAAKDVPDKESVRIFLEFDSVQGGQFAKAKFTNRYFGGRYVNCLFYEPTLYKAGQYFEKL